MFITLVKVNGRCSDSKVAVNLDEVQEVKATDYGQLRITWRHPDREESYYYGTLDEFLALANGGESKDDIYRRALESMKELAEILLKGERNGRATT